MASLFEGYERRIDQINAVLNSYGISSIEEAEKITKDAGLNVYDQVKKIQPICFENACWAYTVGAAIAIKKGCKRAADAAAAIGEGLQAFCIPGSVADHRKVGLGHGNLGMQKLFLFVQTPVQENSRTVLRIMLSKFRIQTSFLCRLQRLFRSRFLLITHQSTEVLIPISQRTLLSRLL